MRSLGEPIWSPEWGLKRSYLLTSWSQTSSLQNCERTTAVAWVSRSMALGYTSLSKQSCADHRRKTAPGAELSLYACVFVTCSSLRFRCKYSIGVLFLDKDTGAQWHKVTRSAPVLTEPEPGASWARPHESFLLSISCAMDVSSLFIEARFSNVICPIPSFLSVRMWHLFIFLFKTFAPRGNVQKKSKL